MDLPRPSSGHDQAEDPLNIHHPEEEEHHESRASKMFGKVKAKAKKFKDRLTKHGDEQEDHDVVEDEGEDDDESDEPETEKHLSAVNEVSNVSQPEFLTHRPKETSVPASTEEITPSETKDYSTDYNTGRVEPEPLRDATYEAPPSYPIRTSDVLSEGREESRETHHVPLSTPVSLLSETEEDVTTPGEDGLLGGQREVNTDMPKRFEDELSGGESTYYHTQLGSGEEDDQKKSGLGAELASESGIKKDWTETEVGKDIPTRSFESETGNDSSPTVFGGKPDDFQAKINDFDRKIESRIEKDGGKLGGTEVSEDYPAKSQEFEQTIGSEIGEDNGAGKPGTERREDFLGKSYEFDQEIESTFGKDSPTRLPEDETFPTRSDGDDTKVEVGLPTETTTDDDHFSPEFSGPKERDDFDSQEVKPTTYSEMIGSATDEKVIATKNVDASSIGYTSEIIAGGQHESPAGVETVAADKLTTDDENVEETATTKLSFSGDGREADETEQGRDIFVQTRDHHLEEEKLTPEEEVEDKAFSDMVAEKLNLGGEKQTTIKEEEKIPSDKLPEKIEGGEAVEEEGKEGGGIVGTIKGVYNYWLGGTEEGKPKSPTSVEESSSQPLSSTIGTKGFSDSDESGLGETGSTTGAVAVQKQV